jgi:hypothetical protein
MAARLRGLILILVIVVGIYVAYKMLPPLFTKYQLQEDLDDIARIASYRVISDEDLKAQVISRAQGENILLKEDQITISRATGALGITVHYKVTVDLKFTMYEYDFTVNSLNKRI